MSTTPTMVRLIAEGVTRSLTFAALTQQLVSSNVLVTVEPVYRMKAGLSGYMVFVTHTQFRRYVRVYVDGRLFHDQQISILGHELRHALEVAGHPEVVDEATLRAMYVSIGHQWSGASYDSERWESDGAIAAGRLILQELQTRATTPPAVTAAGGR